MISMKWSIQTSEIGVLPIVVSEYLFSKIGVFIKSEIRMPKKEVLTALTGYRIGYEAVKGTDYRMAPWNRNTILWHKIISIVEDKPGNLIIRGNTEDVITVSFNLEDRDRVVQYLKNKRCEHPPIVAADPIAAAWICWRDDDEWEDRYMSLEDMIKSESKENRFIEDYILEETILDEASIKIKIIENTTSKIKKIEIVRPKYCNKCGTSLPLKGSYCGNCGNKFI